MVEKTVTFITILAAVAGWLTTRIVDRVVNTPTIEYLIDDRPAEQGRLMTIHLTNITRTQHFPELWIEARTSSDDNPILDASVHPVEPAFEGTRAPDRGGRTARAYIENLQPSSSVAVRVFYRGGARPAMSATSVGTPARFQERNWETQLSRYEVEALIGLLVTWTFLTFIFLKRHRGGGAG